jgi:hypothetical protein
MLRVIIEPVVAGVSVIAEMLVMVADASAVRDVYS